jgi:mono/diheme cytochrome c family protein
MCDPFTRWITRVSPAIALLLALTAAPCMAAAPKREGNDYPQKDTREAAVLRGEIAFQNYCVLCHGINADGQGRAARIYNPKPANLRASMVTDAYKASIIRKGGKAMGRSEFMPPWSEELTNEQVDDVVQYLRTIAPSNAPR